MISSYAPLLSRQRAAHERMTVSEITSEAFEPSSMMCKTDPRHGKYIAACLMYRGDVIPKVKRINRIFDRNKRFLTKYFLKIWCFDYFIKKFKFIFKTYKTDKNNISKFW